MTESSPKRVELSAVRAVSEPAPAPGLTRSQCFLAAIGCLIVVYGVGLGVTIAGGAVIHAVDPSRHVNTFAALHNPWIVAVLIGITVLCLTPPYPWARRKAAGVGAPGSRDQTARTTASAEENAAGGRALAPGTPGPAPRLRSIDGRRQGSTGLPGAS